MDKPRTLIVCHDAGGAEVISSYLRAKRLKRMCFYILEGPAVSIFGRKLKTIKNHSMNELPSLLSKVDRVIAGTSWQSDIEKKAILEANKRHITSISHLDHWFNFRERYLYKNILVKPTQIWVGDRYAYHHAKNCFSNVRIQLKKNFYFQDLKKELSRYKPEKDQNFDNVLYICEPYSQVAKKLYANANYFGVNEEKLLFMFLQYCVTHCSASSIRIRLHPSEVKGKYDKIICQFPQLNLSLSYAHPLYEDIVWARGVYGGTSMALVIALFAKKAVYTCLTPSSRLTLLPYKEIMQLKLDEQVAFQ